MPVTTNLTNRNRHLLKIVVTKRKAAIVTKTAEAIMTALLAGPSTARDLSHRLHGIDYANLRQTLSRLAKSGAVTKLARGLYAVGGCDEALIEASDEAQEVHGLRDAELSRLRPSSQQLVQRQPTKDDLRIVALAWANFNAMNDPHDPRAWK
jgi:DNA-binding transcriptional ArsR family regulator